MIPAVERLRQEKCQEFKTNLDYTARPCLKKQEQKCNQTNVEVAAIVSGLGFSIPSTNFNLNPAAIDGLVAGR